ncbi:4-(cytidine 5'-diphospho)-2-C-methyl-D-erythritol kinase [Sphingomonas sp. SUN019]|uniref:4-(cytidine 5'-diphospho)-2-C-methyl-D-erythritol kinase n=1 Tax=Sphingomonas sp. SUN019 TaxID=2937788 RepID=UPI0021644199|nr:4-(cytidine 5'-diphospho)-2-C-methyl-D-erythritol kinase [Sphingomonas sp. SUN019]UVO49422.1 4-(cytidine 5'-diphospho)-2-C-methyl-D-erythritol kinase [Sphingomonas sp. SUN019]
MIVEPAPAKLNLALHVRRRRPDGYHDIETLFAFCHDGDTVALNPSESPRFHITGPFAADLSPTDDPWANNLVTRAADAFAAQFGAGPYDIILDKHLPIASGIGGGSADAAATLRALSRRRGIPLDDPMLLAIAGQLGADVPACLAGVTAFATGRGDALTALEGWADTPVLLVNPRVALSTARVFAAWDGTDRGALDPAAPEKGRNDLEAPARRLAPSIDDVLDALAIQPGATLVRMSGSGATCFALFDTIAERDAADMAIASIAPDWWRLATTLA